MSLLRVTIDLATGERISKSLTPGRRWLVGRDATCDIRIPGAEGKVSRLHAAITCHDGEWRIEDLQSTNGTWIDDNAVSGTVALTPGQRVAFGTIAAVITWEDAPVQQGSTSVGSSTALVRALRNTTQRETTRIDRLDRVIPGEEDEGSRRKTTPDDRFAAGDVAAVPASAPAAARVVSAPLPVVDPVPSSPVPLPGHPLPVVDEPQASVAVAQGRPAAKGVVCQLLGRRYLLPRDRARTLKARELRGDLASSDLMGLPEADA
jgi:pSer/pThr/pTyr-binding forkhead associated (FHA) protein